MKKWSIDDLVSLAGRHVLSEEHLRVQVLEVMPRGNGDLWRLPYGAVLVIVLTGSCKLLLEEGREVAMNVSDQVVLFAGEAFGFEPASPSSPPAVLQFVWVPGISGRSTGEEATS
jgi:quercetin dioxygenase-like cupin family protein